MRVGALGASEALWGGSPARQGRGGRGRGQIAKQRHVAASPFGSPLPHHRSNAHPSLHGDLSAMLTPLKHRVYNENSQLRRNPPERHEVDGA